MHPFRKRPPTFAKATVGKANSRCAKVSAKALATAENYEYRIQTFVSKTQQTMSKTILFASAENMYVYILKSINNPKKKYVGTTKNPTQKNEVLGSLRPLKKQRGSLKLSFRKISTIKINGP